MFDVYAVSNWIRKYNDQFSSFEKTLNNGIYSILETKVKDITPLLKKGNRSFPEIPPIQASLE